MSGIEGNRPATQETELSDVLHIVDVPTIVPSLRSEREVFVIRIPGGMDLEAERAAYELRGGQEQTYGATVDIDMVTYQQWLVARGGEIQHRPDLIQTA